MKAKVLVTCGGLIGSSMAKMFEDKGYEVIEDASIELKDVGFFGKPTPEEVFQLKKIYHEVIKRPFTHLDNQKFLQQKMQGKRRVY